MQDKFLLQDFSMMATAIERNIQNYGREYAARYYKNELHRMDIKDMVFDTDAILTAFGL